MKLDEIIKNDSDRLFLVDTECFIIFTGDSIQDERPFIRIGTWMDLPVEIIPLIENVVITDTIKGDPSHEQFNIDIRNFQSNRYIGSEGTLKRFLDYQRNFGLDLTNVSIVNIDKDIPELPKKRNISHRDHFIGVFYSNGNIKIVHSGKDIFDLQSISTEYPDISAIHEGISGISRNDGRYSGSGFIIFDANPVFYSGGYFTSYQYPGNYYSRFSHLRIDPNKIRELILPSENIINISGLLKYKNTREGKIRLFSDNTDQTDLIKKLFKSATIIDQNFTGMNYLTGDGLKIESIDNTPNLRLTYKEKKNQKNDIVINFIKSHSGAKAILKEKARAIIVTYTAYEESSLLFSSTDTPVFILNDGNPNIRKLHDIDRDLLLNGIQYEFITCDTIEEIYTDRIIDRELIEALAGKNISAINEKLESMSADPSRWKELFNTLSLLKVHVMNTTDRKLSSSLKNIYQKNITKLNYNLIESNSAALKSVMVFYNNGCHQFLEETGDAAADFYSDYYDETLLDDRAFADTQKKLCSRIVKDRVRLRNLIDLFYEDRKDSEIYNSMRSEIDKLSREISDRKEIYSREIYLNDINTVVKAASGKKSSRQGEEAAVNSPDMRTEEYAVKPSLIPSVNKKYLIAGVAALLIIIAIISFIFLRKSDSGIEPILTEDELLTGDTPEGSIITVTRINADEKKILEKSGVTISNLDIYNYANDVAIKNGYARLSYQGFQNKNPNWIYPSNLFIMLDGEKVVVQKGDTLWDLSRAKLEKMNADFYKIIEEIKVTAPSDNRRIKKLINDAEALVYIEQQKNVISEIKKKYFNEQ